MRVPVVIGAVFALAVFAGCGGGAVATPTLAPVASTPTPASQAVICDASGSGTAIGIADFAFNPASANVAANTFVTWTNSDGVSHTVTFDSGPNCGTLAAGASQTVQFTVAGSYAYHCTIHPSMKGTIVVA